MLQGVFRMEFDCLTGIHWLAALALFAVDTYRGQSPHFFAQVWVTV
jgi:hypothetical protein